MQKILCRKSEYELVCRQFILMLELKMNLIYGGKVMGNEKMCSFYVSDFHLITILLPYINEKITEEKEIDVSKSIKRYLKNVKNLNVEKEKILDIGWKEMKKMKNMNLEGKILIVSGEEEFVRNVNQNIIENVSETEILNCYKILNTEDIARIAENYTVFLNTSGKTNAKENSQNEQKRKTIQSQS